MGIVVACKLPHGLTVRHNGQIINLRGPNERSNPLSPAINGAETDNDVSSAGFGLTTLNDRQTEVFKSWSDAVTYKDGSKAKGKLAEPFLPLENGSILSFDNEEDARRETRQMASAITSGFEGIDPDTDPAMRAAGIETNSDAMKKGK